MLSLASLANETSTILLLIIKEEKEMEVFILLLSNISRIAKKYCEVLCVLMHLCLSVSLCGYLQGMPVLIDVLMLLHQ